MSKFSREMFAASVLWWLADRLTDCAQALTGAGYKLAARCNRSRFVAPGYDR